MTNKYRILTINPGSTSTKVALFEGEDCTFSANVSHDAACLRTFPTITSQLSFRKEAILAELAKAGVVLDGLSAVVGRGGGLFSTEGGTYAVNDVLLRHAQNGENGVQHPAQLGPQLAGQFAQQCGCPAFVVNPPDTDEFSDEARMTGVKGIYKTSHLHALNLKETAIRHAESLGKAYADCNFIVCHLGGGVSVSAHKKGRMIDGNDIVGGIGPMAPTRCGSVPVAGIVKLLEEGVTPAELRKLCTAEGGFVSHLGTSDAKKVAEDAREDRHSALVWRSFLYQVEKEIGAMACALSGKVDGILLGGGMVYSRELVESIRENCGWIAPVTAYPGEFEMEAMAAGAARVLDGKEEVREYTGRPAFDGFGFE